LQTEGDKCSLFSFRIQLCERATLRTVRHFLTKWSSHSSHTFIAMCPSTCGWKRRKVEQLVFSTLSVHFFLFFSFRRNQSNEHGRTLRSRNLSWGYCQGRRSHNIFGTCHFSVLIRTQQSDLSRPCAYCKRKVWKMACPESELLLEDRLQTEL
jgi:hypothetical protein